MSTSSGFVFPIDMAPQIICFSNVNEFTLQVNTEKYNFVVASNITQFFTYLFNLPIKAIVFESEADKNDNTYNLCEIIRNNSKTADIPIFIAVDNYFFQDFLVSKMYGVNEYISRQMFEKKISQIVDKYL